MAQSFKHTSTMPADYTEPTAPPASPLISPERDACERRLQRWKRERSISYSPPTYPNLAAQEAALGLPSMIPEEEDTLCILPSNKARAKHETIRPDQHGKYYCHYNPAATKLQGRESVERQLHQLSLSGREPSKGYHEVGVDAPWMPDELTPAYAREANRAYGEKWEREANTLPRLLETAGEVLRDGVTTSNTTGESGTSSKCTEEESPQLKPGDTDWEDRQPLRCINASDVGKPFPIGAGPGEKFTAIDAPPLERASERALSNRPPRPVGVHDPAERTYFAQMQRRRRVKEIMKEGWTVEAACEVAEREFHTGRSWAEMEKECEKAEMVMRVEGKLAPLKEWLPPPPPKPERKKASPRGKGRGKGKAGLRSAAGDAAGAEQLAEGTGPQDPSTTMVDVAVAGEAVATSIEANDAERGSLSPSPSYRGKRTRKPTAKAVANGVVEGTPTQTPSLSAGDDSSEAEEEVLPSSPVKRQRRSSGELMPPPAKPSL